MLWVLNLSDGEHGLLDIAERRSSTSVRSPPPPTLLEAHGLLEELATPTIATGAGKADTT